MASSVAWSLELPLLPAQPFAEGWFQAGVEVVVAAEGYTNMRTHLWSPHGQLLSLGTQVVAVFG